MHSTDTAAHRFLPALYIGIFWLLVSALLLKQAWIPGAAPDLADNDDMMRLVQMRDLLAGQSWFDLTQYRMAPPDGVFMHWSRLIDAPLAALTLLFKPFTGAATAEHLTLYVWPLLILLPLLYILCRLSRLLIGPDSLLPCLLLAALLTSVLTNFRPGQIDHHNVQLLLTIALLTALVSLPATAAAICAGLIAALSLAVGMETLPFVALGVLIVGVIWVWRGADAAPMLQAFGVSFAGATTFLFVLTVAPGRYLIVACDALSSAQLTAISLGAVDCIALAGLSARLSSWPRRLTAAAFLGALTIAIVAWAFPACVGDPYANLPPRLIKHWLADVGEAKPLLEMAMLRPAVTATNVLYPLIMLGAMIMAWHHSDTAGRTRWSMAISFLTLAITLSFWQVRVTQYSNLLGLPGAAWILTSLIRTSRDWAVGKRVLSVLAVWFVCNNITFYLMLDNVVTPFAPPARFSPEKDQCVSPQTMAELNSLPATATMINLIDMGAPILTYTPHRVMAGPYHRNIAGNLLSIDTFILPPQEAYQRARQSDADHVIYCTKMGDVTDWAMSYPDSLIARLSAGTIPDWLEPVALPAGSALRLFKIKQP